MKFLKLLRFFNLHEYPFKVESKNLYPQVRIRSYLRAHPDSVIKVDFFEGNPLNCCLFFYDDSGKKIEFNLTHDFSMKNGKYVKSAKPVLVKKIDGLTIPIQKTDLEVFKEFTYPHLKLLEEQEKVGEKTKEFFEQHAKI
ncbi:Uncharacterised protein [uncultured archaeon]|nr:Uncharacterised protein [uncultured archaeon]